MGEAGTGLHACWAPSALLQSKPTSRGALIIRPCPTPRSLAAGQGHTPFGRPEALCVDGAVGSTGVACTRGSDVDCLALGFLHPPPLLFPQNTREKKIGTFLSLPLGGAPKVLGVRAAVGLGVSCGAQPSPLLLPEQLLQALHILLWKKRVLMLKLTPKCLKPLDKTVPEVPPSFEYFMKTFLEPIYIFSW